MTDKDEELPMDDSTSKPEPLEVNIINARKEKKWNDSQEDYNYDAHEITEKEIKEFQDGDT